MPNIEAELLTTNEDFQWLHEVHGIDARGYFAAQVGTFNSGQDYALLYSEDDYRCEPELRISLTKEERELCIRCAMLAQWA